MSRWRQIKNRSLSQGHSLSHSRSHQKFTPKKDEEIAQSKLFRNQQIAKIRNTFIESQMMNRSRAISASCHDVQMASTKKNNKSEGGVKRFETEQFQFLKGTKEVSSKIKKIHTFDYGRNNQVTHELQALKHEFEEFKAAVMKQIKKKQEDLIKMFRQIMRLLKACQNNTSYEKNLQRNREFQNSSPYTLQEVDIQKIQTNISLNFSLPQLQANKDIPLFRDTSLKDSPESIQESIYRKYQKEKSGPKDTVLFGRFFEAMNNIKEQMKEIGRLNELAGHSNQPTNNRFSGVRKT